MEHATEIKLFFEKMHSDRTEGPGKKTLLWPEAYGWLAQWSSTTYVATNEKRILGN